MLYQFYLTTTLEDTITDGALKKLIDSKNAKEFRVFINETKEVRRSYNIPKNLR